MPQTSYMNPHHSCNFQSFSDLLHRNPIFPRPEGGTPSISYFYTVRPERTNNSAFDSDCFSQSFTRISNVAQELAKPSNQDCDKVGAYSHCILADQQYFMTLLIPTLSESRTCRSTCALLCSSSRTASGCTPCCKREYYKVYLADSPLVLLVLITSQKCKSVCHVTLKLSRTWITNLAHPCPRERFPDHYAGMARAIR